VKLIAVEDGCWLEAKVSYVLSSLVASEVWLVVSWVAAAYSFWFLPCFFLPWFLFP
jgi:hypothetical protein